MSAQYKLTYFNGAGRAEPIRLAFHVGGVQFEDERIEFKDLASLKPSLPYGQLPVLEVKQGGQSVVLGESLALLRFAGKVGGAGLYPADSLQAAKVDELLDAWGGISNLLASTMSIKDPEALKTRRVELANDIIPTKLATLDKRLAQLGSDGYSVGSQLTVADLSAYSAVTQLASGRLDHIPTDLADSHSHIMAAHDKVKNHPKVQEYYAAKQS